MITQFEASIAALDHTQPDCKQHISALRAKLEAAYAARDISLHQFRLLWEEISVVQARHAMVLPDGWRIPRQEGDVLAYVPPPPAVPKR